MAQGNTRLARRLVRFASVFDAVMLFLLICGAYSSAEGAFWWTLLLLGTNGAIAYYAYSQGLFFELMLERRWKAVCVGLGGNFAGGRIQPVANPLWIFGGSLMHTYEQKIVPKLREVHGTYDSWNGVVTPFAGQTVEEYNKKAPAFAQAFHVPYVTFTIAENGLLRIRAGQSLVPEAHSHQPRLSTLGYSPLRLVNLLGGVPVAKDVDGNDWRMPVEGQHVLIAARTGGGKGSWIWNIVLGLKPAIQAGYVVLWGCDPKRLELAIGRNWWHHYADTDTAIVEMLEECVSEMFKRADQLQGKARKFTPSREMPLNVIIVDELGYLSALMPDKALRGKAEKALSTLLSQGRALGYAVIGAVQDPRKETVGFRDLFPVRIAGSLPAPMVDLVLGEDMHDAGAYCEQIQLPSGAGVAYVISKDDMKPLCVRAAWCDDETIKQALLGRTGNKPLPADMEQIQLMQ